MRTAFAYTSARILMFGVSVIVLYMAGARGILLLGLGLVISALGSYILLNKQRQVIADKLNGRLSRVGSKATEFRARLEAGTAAEDPEAESPEAERPEAESPEAERPEAEYLADGTAEVTDAPAASAEPAAPGQVV